MDRHEWDRMSVRREDAAGAVFDAARATRECLERLRRERDHLREVGAHRVLAVARPLLEHLEALEIVIAETRAALVAAADR